MQARYLCLLSNVGLTHTVSIPCNPKYSPSNLRHTPQIFLLWSGFLRTSPSAKHSSNDSVDWKGFRHFPLPKWVQEFSTLPPEASATVHSLKRPDILSVCQSWGKAFFICPRGPETLVFFPKGLAPEGVRRHLYKVYYLLPNKLDNEFTTYAYYFILATFIRLYVFIWM